MGELIDLSALENNASLRMLSLSGSVCDTNLAILSPLKTCAGLNDVTVPDLHPDEIDCLALPEHCSLTFMSPRPPPGANWVAYQDDGGVWWHYAGHLQWWCTD